MNLLRMNVVTFLLHFICILIQHQSTLASNSMIQWNTYVEARHEIRYNWTIPEFTSLVGDKNRVSTEIPIDEKEMCKWRVKLYTRDLIDNYYHKFLCLKAELINCGKDFKKAIVKFKASIINNEQEEERSMEEVKQLTAVPDEIHWSSFCEIDRDLRNRFLVNDTLTVSIQISYYLECSNHTTALGSNIVKCDLFDDLGSLLENPKHADVELVLLNNKTYYAHRAILAARSRYIARMFEKFDKIYKRIVINVTNVDEETMDGILRYIYTGKCEISNLTSERLLMAADQYELAELKTLCSESMCKDLSVKNAAKFLLLADKYRLDEFKSKVVNFIVENSFQVLNTTDWKSMIASNLKLLGEMCEVFAYRRAT